MFTGIVTDVGTVLRVEKPGDTRFVIQSAYDPAGLDIGATIACSGAGLTVLQKGADDKGAWFAVEASEATLSCTSLRGWAAGSRVNLERPLRVGDEIGGHIVSGHVDGVGKVVLIEPAGESVRYVFEAPQDHMKHVAVKGSITVEGVSLTVNDIEGLRFGVNLISHSLSKTSFGDLKVGSEVNLEIDILARYVARLQDMA
jgi:riboflavin synthase